MTTIRQLMNKVPTQDWDKELIVRVTGEVYATENGEVIDIEPTILDEDRQVEWHATVFNITSIDIEDVEIRDDFVYLIIGMEPHPDTPPNVAD